MESQLIIDIYSEVSVYDLVNITDDETIEMLERNILLFYKVFNQEDNKASMLMEQLS